MTTLHYTPSVDVPADLNPEDLEEAVQRGQVELIVMRSYTSVKVADQWGLDVDAYEVKNFALAYRTGLTVERNDGYGDYIDDVVRCMIDPRLWFVVQPNYIDYTGGRNYAIHPNTPVEERPNTELRQMWERPSKHTRYVIEPIPSEPTGNLVPTTAGKLTETVLSLGRSMIRAHQSIERNTDPPMVGA